MYTLHSTLGTSPASLPSSNPIVLHETTHHKIVSQPTGTMSPIAFGLAATLPTLAFIVPVTFCMRSRSRCRFRRRRRFYSKALSPAEHGSLPAFGYKYSGLTAPPLSDTTWPLAVKPLPRRQVSARRHRLTLLSPCSSTDRYSPQRCLPVPPPSKPLVQDDPSRNTSSRSQPQFESELSPEDHLRCQEAGKKSSSESLISESFRSPSEETILPFQKKDPLPPSVIAAKSVASILKRPREAPSPYPWLAARISNQESALKTEFVHGHTFPVIGGLQSWKTVDEEKKDSYIPKWADQNRQVRGNISASRTNVNGEGPKKKMKKAVKWGEDEVRHFRREYVESP